MCGTSPYPTTAPLRSEVPMPWHTVTAEVHNANVCPSKMAERGANASPGAVLADRDANGATEDGLLRVNKHTAGRTEGDMHGGKHRTPFPPQPLPPLSPWLLPCHRTGYLRPMSATRTAKPMTSSKRMPSREPTVLYCTRNLARGSLFRVVPLSELAPSRKAMMSLKRCA